MNAFDTDLSTHFEKFMYRTNCDACTHIELAQALLLELVHRTYCDAYSMNYLFNELMNYSHLSIHIFLIGMVRVLHVCLFL